MSSAGVITTRHYGVLVNITFVRGGGVRKTKSERRVINGAVVYQTRSSGDVEHDRARSVRTNYEQKKLPRQFYGKPNNVRGWVSRRRFVDRRHSRPTTDPAAAMIIPCRRGKSRRPRAIIYTRPFRVDEKLRVCTADGRRAGLPERFHLTPV